MLADKYHMTNGDHCDGLISKNELANLTQQYIQARQ